MFPGRASVRPTIEALVVSQSPALRVPPAEPRDPSGSYTADALTVLIGMGVLLMISPRLGLIVVVMAGPLVALCRRHERRYELAARRAHAALSLGNMTLHAAEADVLAYERRDGTHRLFVALNMSNEPRGVALPEGTRAGAIVVATGTRTAFDGTLAPDEGLVIELET